MERLCSSRILQDSLRTFRKRYVDISSKCAKIYARQVSHNCNFRAGDARPWAREGCQQRRCGSRIRNIGGKIKFMKQQRQFHREARALSAMFVRSVQSLQLPTNGSVLGVQQRMQFNTSAALNDPKQQDEYEDQKGSPSSRPSLLQVAFMLLLVTLFEEMMASGNVQALKSIPVENWSMEQIRDKLLLSGEILRVKVIHGALPYVFLECNPNSVVNGQIAHQGEHREVKAFNGLALRVTNMGDFVEKLREAEESLGISTSDSLYVEHIHGNRYGIMLLLFVTMALLSPFLRSPRLIMSRFGQNGKKNVQQFSQGKKGVSQGPGKKSINQGKKRNKKTLIDAMLGNKTSVSYVRGDLLAKLGNAVSLSDVAGMKQAKMEVMEFVDYLKNPGRMSKLGGKHPHGLILLGPPGCGKTLLAKAVATEAGVPFFALAGSEFVEMIGGLGASRMRKLFDEAREQAPSIIYIDEIDAIGRKRTTGGDQGTSEEEHTLNQLLVELDGMETTEGVIVMISTNRPDILDQALLRPGRFDRRIDIDLPTVDEREEIFHVYMKKLTMKTDYKLIASRLAMLTTGMSGADIANICNGAALHTARQGRDSIDMGDFNFSLERIVAGAEKKSSVITTTERKVIAYHESGHALVGWMLQHTDALLKVSIVPRTSNIFGFAQIASNDHYLYSNDSLFDIMCMMLGGRAAETIIFNHVTQGAQDDLKKVTKQAYDQIRRFGMNERVGCISFGSDSTEGFSSRPYSDSLADIIDQEAKNLISKAYYAAQDILTEHKDKLHLLSQTLLEKETLSYDEIRDLIGPPPHGDKVQPEMVKVLTETTHDKQKSEPALL